MKEYKIAKVWAIFIYIFSPLLILIFGVLLFFPFIPGMNTDFPIGLYLILIPISLGMIAVSVFGIIEAYKGKFTIDEDKIYLIGVFKTKQLLFSEIKGFRIVQQYIFIEPNTTERKKLKLSTYYGKSDEIIEWLSIHYPNLDVHEAEVEHGQILEDQELGRTTEEREEKLNNARKWARIINWAGGLAGAWAWFFPTPYEYANLTCIIIPLVSVAVVKFSGGLIRIEEKKNSAYPSVFWAVMVPSAAIAIRALNDFDIFEYQNLWTPSISIAIGLIAIAIIGSKDFLFNKLVTYFTILAITLLFFAYSYGSVIFLNCYYDRSEALVYEPTILSKRISSGKTTSYYLKLTPWGTRTENEEVSVTKDLYDSLDEKDVVVVYLQKGQFNIPWFFVMKAE